MAGASTGWEPTLGDRPFPPANVQVIHSFIEGCLDIRWDDPSILNTGPTLVANQATATLTVSGTPVVLTTATGTATVSATPITAGDRFIVGGVVLTAVAGARTPGSNDFDGSLVTVLALAAEIAAALSDASNSFQAVATAVAVGSVITLTAVLTGTAGNVAMSTDSANLTLSGTALTGGLDADTVTIAGRDLTAVAGARTSGSNDFSVDGTNFDVADSIAAAINDAANGFVGFVTATAAFGQVTLTAVPIGARGNTISLATTASATITVSGAFLGGGTGSVNCTGQTNAAFNIIGVNLYRSDTGERGPYFRINRVPLGGLFYRDCTDNQLVDAEVVDWDAQWISKGDAANNRRWRFRTQRCAVVKRDSQAVAADSPSDVIVAIDGVVVPVDRVFGVTGEIDLINLPVFDPATEKLIQPVLPNEDGSSVVTVTYYRQTNFVKTDLETKAKIHYRLTTVALDPSGTTPSGLLETPLGWSPPANIHDVEQLDYIWRTAVRYNRWILEQGGERVKLFIRRVTGIQCPCQWDERLFEFAQHPLNNCGDCFGTGFLVGYEGPIDLIIAPDDAERRVTQTPNGRHLEHSYEVWTGPRPLLTQRDFIVKQTGERYSIGPVRRPAHRGLPLQQHFNIAYLSEGDIRYKVPLHRLEQLPWPQTRVTRPEEAPCADADPFPVGFDYQATPMETEAAKIPDGREIRGRTPIWANIQYGGKGGS